MNNIVKYIYCLSLSNSQCDGDLIGLYSKYMKLSDMRTLPLRVRDRFGTRDRLVSYLLNRKEYRDKAKKRWKKINKYCEGNKIPTSEWTDD